MIKLNNVMSMLCPTVEYIARGENYEDIDWLGEEPAITKKQFTDGFLQYDAWKAEQDAAKAAKRAELLFKLGITEEEARILLG